jgi:hypothetical protein
VADLLIRYCNGRRTVAIDHRSPNKLECNLHDRTRERRIPLPPELETLSLKQIEKAMEMLFHE